MRWASGPAVSRWPGWKVAVPSCVQSCVDFFAAIGKLFDRGGSPGPGDELVRLAAGRFRSGAECRRPGAWVDVGEDGVDDDVREDVAFCQMDFALVRKSLNPMEVFRLAVASTALFWGLQHSMTTNGLAAGCDSEKPSAKTKRIALR
jgi:hypothetical protein